MFLYFDKEGTLKTKIDHGEKLRQGGDMNVTVCLDTDFWSSKKRGDYSLELNALLMTLVFPDETKSISQTADSVSERVFEKLYDSEIVYDLVPGKTYLMYDFFFSAESATPYFGKLRINLTAGNSITTNDYVRFGDESEWISSNPKLASGEAGIEKSCDSYGNVTYISKIGRDNLKFTELGGAEVQTSELDPILPPQEGSGYGNYWINTINKTVWLYNESLRTWTQVITFGVNDTVEPVTIAFATTEAYVEKTIGFAKAQIDQQISIKYNDIMARFKDVYSKLGMALIKPDWNQQESGKQSYIFNKPNIKNTDVYHIDNLGEETGLFFVKNDSGRANPVYDDYILFQYAGKHQIVWREVSVSFGRTKFGDTWSEWQKNNAEGSLTGNTAPTGELAGVLGQLYLKKDTKDLYYCAKDTEPYEWIPLSKVIKSISTIDSQAGYSETKGITVQSNEKILYADNSESEAIQTTRDIPVKIGRGIKVKQSDVDPNVIEIYTDLEAKLNENIEKNPSKTYFLIEGNFEQPSIGAHLNPKGWIIDWGDGVVEESVKATPLKHDYDDGFSWHIITMSNMRKLPSYIFDGEKSTNKVKKAWIGNGIIDTGDNQSIISESDDIEEVYFADGITSLVFCPLNDCPNLKKIKLPNTLTGIPNYFLGGNSKPLTNELKLLIPKSVTSFEGYYADNQPNLVTIMEGVEPPSASTTTFARYKGSKIIVPKSAVNTYKTATGWSTQAKKIVYEVDSSDIETKYDKTGGRIEGDVIVVGDLTVNGEQHILNTENLAVKNAMIYSNSEAAEPLIKKGGIGIKTNATDVYGVVYDPQSDSVKLGLGKADANGNFDFNANEGNPVAVRDDSNAFTNKHLVEWSDSGKKLVDSGFSAEEFVPIQSESADKYYAQITNENGVISLRVFQNGSPDTQNLVIDKNGVTILGQKLVPGGGGENKVDKLPASLRTQAYVRDKDGNDTGLAYTYTDEGNTLAVRNASGQVQVSTPSQDNDAANKKFVEDNLNSILYHVQRDTQYSTTLLTTKNIGKYYTFTTSVLTTSDYWVDPDNITVNAGTVVKILPIEDSHGAGIKPFFKIVGIDNRELYLTNGQGKCSIVKRAYGSDITPKAIGYYSNIFSVDTDKGFGGQVTSKYTTLFGANVRADSNSEGSIVGGRYCIADSAYTLMYGKNLTTQGSNETLSKVVLGYNNKFNTKAILEIGNGTDTLKSNAFEVLKDGRAKVQSAPTENNDVLRYQDTAVEVETSLMGA